MIDLILFFFVVGVFVLGFWCGKTFTSVGQMIDRTVATVKGWMS